MHGITMLFLDLSYLFSYNCFSSNISRSQDEVWTPVEALRFLHPCFRFTGSRHRHRRRRRRVPLRRHLQLEEVGAA